MSGFQKTAMTGETAEGGASESAAYAQQENEEVDEDLKQLLIECLKKSKSVESVSAHLAAADIVYEDVWESSETDLRDILNTAGVSPVLRGRLIRALRKNPESGVSKEAVKEENNNNNNNNNSNEAAPTPTPPVVTTPNNVIFLDAQQNKLMMDLYAKVANVDKNMASINDAMENISANKEKAIELVHNAYNERLKLIETEKEKDLRNINVINTTKVNALSAQLKQCTKTQQTVNEYSEQINNIMNDTQVQMVQKKKNITQFLLQIQDAFQQSGMNVYLQSDMALATDTTIDYKADETQIKRQLLFGGTQKAPPVSAQTTDDNDEKLQSNANANANSNSNSNSSILNNVGNNHNALDAIKQRLFKPIPKFMAAATDGEMEALHDLNEMLFQASKVLQIKHSDTLQTIADPVLNAIPGVLGNLEKLLKQVLQHALQKFQDTLDKGEGIYKEVEIELKQIKDEFVLAVISDTTHTPAGEQRDQAQTQIRSGRAKSSRRHKKAETAVIKEENTDAGNSHKRLKHLHTRWEKLKRDERWELLAMKSVPDLLSDIPEIVTASLLPCLLVSLQEFGSVMASTVWQVFSVFADLVGAVHSVSVCEMNVSKLLLHTYRLQLPTANQKVFLDAHLQWSAQHSTDDNNNASVALKPMSMPAAPDLSENAIQQIFREYIKNPYLCRRLVPASADSDTSLVKSENESQKKLFQRIETVCLQQYILPYPLRNIYERRAEMQVGGKASTCEWCVVVLPHGMHFAKQIKKDIRQLMGDPAMKYHGSIGQLCWRMSTQNIRTKVEELVHDIARRQYQLDEENVAQQAIFAAVLETVLAIFDVHSGGEEGECEFIPITFQKWNDERSGDREIGLKYENEMVLQFEHLGIFAMGEELFKYYPDSLNAKYMRLINEQRARELPGQPGDGNTNSNNSNANGITQGSKRPALADISIGCLVCVRKELASQFFKEMKDGQ